MSFAVPRKLFAPICRIVLPVVLISLPNAVFAEIEQTQEVVQDSYIIVPKSAVSAAGAIVSGSIDSRKIANFKLKVNRSLGGKQVLLSRSNAANEDELNEETVIAYRAEDDKCPALLASGAVEECSPNYRIHVETTPDDPKMGELWGMSALHGIDATGAWNVSTGSEEVVVAIIDTGIDYTHPDLAANIWTNPLEIPGNGRDDDNDGVVDDIHGANFTTRDTSGRPVPSGDPKDDHLHGTHVAGTIGGVGNNHLGVAGVNWNVKMMGLKFLDKNGSGSLSDAISAINLMVKLKKRGVNIRVSNNSWGGGGYAAALYSAIRDARDAGIIFVAAAGNSASDNDARASYPANYDLSNVVSVAAIDVEQNLASFSNYGATQVDIAAPGVNIYSTVPGGYATLSGTSMATPHVTGALALLLANEPNLSADQAIARLYDTGSRIASLEGVVRTGRKLNARKLLVGDTSDPVPPPAAPPVPCSYTISEIQFNPDQDVLNSPIVLQTDELQTYDFAMPFSFPFYRDQMNVAHVSANGVLYFRKAPDGLDYTNASRAPANSIAALHTDLYATPGGADGVRVSKDSEKVVILFDEKSYDGSGLGNVKVWLHLYSTGIIEEYISFGSASLAKMVRQHATVGIAGPTRQMYDTYAVNSARIKDGLALRYTPECSGAAANASVKKVTISPKGNAGIVPGAKIGIRVAGRGDGMVALSASFNGQSCAGQTAGYMNEGSLRMSARLPKLNFERLTLTANGKRAATSVRGARSRQARARRLDAARLNTLCQRFFASVR